MNTPGGIDPALAKLLAASKLDQFTYTFAMDCLRDYKAPRLKIKHLVDIGALIRIKNGLYLFAQTFARHPYCLESLANIVYGPSYISLEWACQHHRLIPERVEVVTSVTTKRSCHFDTPIRRFSFSHIHEDLYPVGVGLQKFSGGYKALMATKEKALCDLLVVRRGRCRSLKQMEETLFEDLRIEPEDLSTFDIGLLELALDAHPHSAIKYLMQTVKERT